MPRKPRMFCSGLARLARMACMARTFGSLARTLATLRHFYGVCMAPIFDLPSLIFFFISSKALLVNTDKLNKLLFAKTEEKGSKNNKEYLQHRILHLLKISTIWLI